MTVLLMRSRPPPSALDKDLVITLVCFLCTGGSSCCAEIFYLFEFSGGATQESRLVCFGGTIDIMF